MTDQQVLTYIQQYHDWGVTTADHAMVYRSEEPFGRALKLKPELRHQLEIVTKCGIRPIGFGPLGAKAVNHYDSSAKAIIESTHASLRALSTDYVDVLLIHRPDYLMQADEIAEAFYSLKNDGKVRHFGVSNFNVHQFAVLQQKVKDFAAEGLVTNQVECSPYHLDALDNGVFDHCTRHHVSPMLWSCLGAGKLMQPDDDKGRRILQALTIVADELGLNDLEPVVYAWTLTLPCNPLPMLGSRNIDRIKTALLADGLQLNHEQWYRIWEASTGHSVP